MATIKIYHAQGCSYIRNVPQDKVNAEVEKAKKTSRHEIHAIFVGTNPVYFKKGYSRRRRPGRK